MVRYTKFRDDQLIRSRVILGKPEGVASTVGPASVNRRPSRPACLRRPRAAAASMWRMLRDRCFCGEQWRGGVVERRSPSENTCDSRWWARCHCASCRPASCTYLKPHPSRASWQQGHHCRSAAIPGGTGSARTGPYGGKTGFVCGWGAPYNGAEIRLFSKVNDFHLCMENSAFCFSVAMLSSHRCIACKF